MLYVLKFVGYADDPERVESVGSTGEIGPNRPRMDAPAKSSLRFEY